MWNIGFRKRIIASLVVIALLLPTVFIYGNQSSELQSTRPIVIKNPKEDIENHQLISENENLALYLKKDTLSIIIRDKKTGALMYSTLDQSDEKDSEAWQTFMQSGVVMEYLVGTNIVIYRADTISQNPTIQIETHDKGFEATLFYDELELGFTLLVELTETGFIAEIPNDKIIEAGEVNKVSGFYIFPFLGYVESGNRDGYMVIPDGSGALIHLEPNNEKYKQPFSEMVYGSNLGIDDPYVVSLFNGMQPVNEPEKVLMPIYGMVHTDTKIGFLGIIEEGASSAKIEAYPNGAVTRYDWISSKFIYRQFYNQPTSQSSGTIVVRQKNRNDFNIRVRFEFVSGEEANYTGMAVRYRDYILESNQIAVQEEDFHIKLDFLGADSENWLFLKKVIPMTTAENVIEVMNDLRNSGVENIIGVYKGWQKKGIYGGLPIKNYVPEKKIGGKAGFRDLFYEMESLEIPFYLGHDALRINPSENRNYSFDVVKKLNKRVYAEELYKKVYSTLHYLIPEKAKQYLERSAKAYEKHSIHNIMLSGITNILYSYYNGGQSYDRIHTSIIYEENISTLNEKFNLLLEQPFAYLWKYGKAMTDMPMSSSTYIFTDEDIPFLAITLKGIMPMYSKYANFQANKTEYFLKLVEQGVSPSFYLTYEDSAKLLYTNSSNIFSSKYQWNKETIIEYYEKLKPIHEKTKNAFIIGHEKKNNIAKVTYDNGIVIYVNYNKKPIIIEGITVDAQDYKVGEVDG